MSIRASLSTADLSERDYEIYVRDGHNSRTRISKMMECDTIDGI